MQTLSPEQRAGCVHTLADLLISKQSEILDANAKDLSEATKSGVAKPLLSRLSLTPAKLKNLATGLKQIADSSHNNVGRVLRRTKLAEGLELKQVGILIFWLVIGFLIIMQLRQYCTMSVWHLHLYGYQTKICVCCF